MFIVSFFALILALIANYMLDDEKKIKFTDFYEKDEKDNGEEELRIIRN